MKRKVDIAVMITKTEFLNKVNSEIDFVQEEKRRKTLLIQMIFSYIGTLILICSCGLGIIFLFSVKISNLSSFLILILMLACVVLYTNLQYIPNNFYNLYKDKLKDYLIINILAKFDIKKFHNFEYDYSAEIQKSNLFANFANSKYDDILGNKNFIAMETELIHTDEYDSKHGKEEYNSSLFKGLILLCKSNKTINSKTIITSKNDNSINNYISIRGTIKGLLGFLLPIFIIIGYILYLGGKDIFSGTLENMFLLNLLIIPLLVVIIYCFIKIYPIIKTYLKNKKYFENLKLEDISFDKRFKVYSEDQIEGRYLVTPAFMDRLYNLQTAFGVDNIKCSFFEDKIMFAISTKKDLFELGTLYRPFGKDIEQFYEQITSIYNVIDYFKLNERTGL